MSNMASLLFMLMLIMETSRAIDYVPEREPWRTLEREGAMLESKVKLASLSPEEELAIPRSTEVESLAIKLMLDGVKFEAQMANKSAILYQRLLANLTNGLTKVMGAGFPENELFSGRCDLVTVEPCEDYVLVLVLLTTHSGEVPEEAQVALKRSINSGSLGPYKIRSGSAQIFKPVERDTVLELFVQLYNTEFLPGMDTPLSPAYLNMSDQMLHLIGTRFRTVFGESFYRMVVIGFYPSQSTMIVRVNVLLEPDKDNLYHASSIWYSEQGYVHLGMYPLLPSNVVVKVTSVVLKDFFAYLSDRSYRYPLRGDFGLDPFASVTVPSFLGLLVFISLLLLVLRYCQMAAFSDDDDDNDDEALVKG